MLFGLINKKKAPHVDASEIVKGLASGKVTQEQYIQQRVAPVIASYQAAGTVARVRYLWMQCISVIGGGAVPVLVNLSIAHGTLIVTLLSLVVVIFVSLESVLHYRAQWTTYITAATNLEHEFFAMTMGASPYDKYSVDENGMTGAVVEFAQRVETIIDGELQSTLQSVIPMAYSGPLKVNQMSLKK